MARSVAVGDQLWREVTVTCPHERLGDFEGWWVAWRGSGVHVSAPVTAGPDEVSRLRRAGSAQLRQTAFWRTFAQRHGMVVLGSAATPRRTPSASTGSPGGVPCHHRRLDPRRAERLGFQAYAMQLAVRRP